MAKERVAHIDVAAGIMILFMMLGHVCASRLEFTTPHVFLYLQRAFFFFMPWFFYKSGAFVELRSDTNIGGGQIAETIRYLVGNRLCGVCNLSTFMGECIYVQTSYYQTIESYIISKFGIMQRTALVLANFVLCY